MLIELKQMLKKKSYILPALILVSIVLSGCSKNPEPVAANTATANQSSTVLNNNVNQSPAVLNNNNSAVNTTTGSMPIVNNNSLPVAGKEKKPLPSAKEPTPQIGAGAGDLVLFTQARSALSSDSEFIDAVIIEIKEGNVTLTGNVSSEAQKIKAGRLVQSVNGIKSVKNNLRVAS